MCFFSKNYLPISFGFPFDVLVLLKSSKSLTLISTSTGFLSKREVEGVEKKVNKKCATEVRKDIIYQRKVNLPFYRCHQELVSVKTESLL